MIFARRLKKYGGRGSAEDGLEKEAIRKARWDAQHLNFKCGVPLHARVYASRRAARGRWTGRIAVIRRFPARSNRSQPSFLSRAIPIRGWIDIRISVYLPDVRHFRVRT